MTKLEWREITPPCEKKSHLRLSITFHLLQSDSVSVLACQLQFQILDVWTFDLVSSNFLDGMNSRRFIFGEILRSGANS
jgi:hypothetical protein